MADGIGLVLPTLRCSVCGGERVVSVEPGTEAEQAPGLFAVGRGKPMQAWCWDCWPAARGRAT